MNSKPILEMKTEEPSEAKRKKMIEETVQKWLLLQKTVKEEITLEDIIKKQQENDTNKLREYIREYYDLKIKSRKIYEDIRNLKTYEEKRKNNFALSKFDESQIAKTKKEIFNNENSQEMENKNNISTISNLSIDNSRLRAHRTLKSMESDKLDVVSENAENLDSEFGDDN